MRNFEFKLLLLLSYTHCFARGNNRIEKAVQQPKL